MKPGVDKVAQETPRVTRPSATTHDNERRCADIQKSCNLSDGMAVADDARDHVGAFANFSLRRRLAHGSKAPSSLQRPAVRINRRDREPDQRTRPGGCPCGA